ncbi:hypothetical protein C6A27_05005 [Streptococcus anginosus]|uniref:Alpha/beta hydrolase fold-3 domain-containing protein n=1 Tax=Streptococcus anginosus TaxID=1328 RepID=A0A2T0G2Y9_STRAP|nr:alpha/beta hydrolase [Streptococcus anginosus]PRT70405.1 hypothetical protein C6A27_05005 [Streptococcus anginosus]
MKFSELPKKWKRQIILLTSISILFSLLIVGFGLFLQSYRAANEQHRSLLVKPDNQLIGERIVIHREGKNSVKVNIYYPTNGDKTNLPIVFNIHGGGFVGGDVDVLDTQSQRLADQWNSVIVSVNYTKADVKPINYGAEEIKDAVVYFVKNAKQFGIDPSKVTLMGYSAGAYYATESAGMLARDNTSIANVVLAYPWMTGMNAQELGEHYPPTLFVLAGKDQISQNAKVFIEEMKANKKDITVIEYPNAVHSFIESNNPEGLVGATTDMSEVVNDEQQNLARQAENEIYNWLLSH